MTDLQTAMERLKETPGMCPEARALIELAQQAQAQGLGRMPDLMALWEKGSKAWADVPDATDWVEELRGNRQRLDERRGLKTEN